MSSYLIDSSSITSVEQGLSSIFCLRTSHGISWVKFSHRPGSNGAFFIKHLVSPNPEKLKHGKKRRELSRSLILKINELAKRQLLPSPLPLNEKGDVFEHTVKDSPAHLTRTTLTYWSDLPGKPPECTSPNIWDPCSYSTQTVRSLANTLWEVQKLGDQALQEIAPDLDSLSHENRKLIGYETIKHDLLQSLGVSLSAPENLLEQLKDSKSRLHTDLQTKAKKRQQVINNQKIQLANQLGITNTDLNAIAKAFLLKNTPTKQSESSFQQILFYAERDRSWNQEALFLGRTIAQLMLAEEMAKDILENNAACIHSLLTKLYNLQKHYQNTDSFPKGIVHQDAHPAQFHVSEGRFSILDLDDLSYDVCFADLANVYVYKIVRAYHQKKISKNQAIDLLNAVLIPNWIGAHGPNILSHNIASFWNEVMTLIDSYNLTNPQEINLAVTLKGFLEELSNREDYENTYRGLLSERNHNVIP